MYKMPMNTGDQVTISTTVEPDEKDNEIDKESMENIELPTCLIVDMVTTKKSKKKKKKKKGKKKGVEVTEVEQLVKNIAPTEDLDDKSNQQSKDQKLTEDGGYSVPLYKSPSEGDQKVEFFTDLTSQIIECDPLVESKDHKIIDAAPHLIVTEGIEEVDETNIPIKPILLVSTDPNMDTSDLGAYAPLYK